VKVTGWPTTDGTKNEAADGQSELTSGLGSMTDENAKAWAEMGIPKDWQIKRLTDWANMLERRVSELDQLYRAYPFGRSMPKPTCKPRIHLNILPQLYTKNHKPSR
jgi:hypothetical protein